MQLHHRDIIDAPVDVVYDLVKNNLSEICSYLGNIDSIEKISLQQIDAEHTKIVNHWQAKVDLPLLIKKFLSKELISWKDTAIWNNPKQEVHYELTSFVAKDLFIAKGHNTFKALNEGQTELTLTCTVTINAHKVPGIPKLLAAKLLPAIEGIIEKMLQPNIANLGKGIRNYLANKK